MPAFERKYRITKIVSKTGISSRNVLIVYTGGTLGMVKDVTGALVPMRFNEILDRVPELNTLDVGLTVISFPVTLDSSNIKPEDWVSIAYIIKENYQQYDGFVVLHGTDTMAYSASALSYILKGINKPVIFTGAQLPIGARRTDARVNLLTAIEIASTYEGDFPVVPEVCIFFDYKLFRGNRAQKEKSSLFAAFESENYPPLARTGITIEYNREAIAPYNPYALLEFNTEFDQNVVVLRIFPAISQQVVESILAIHGLKGVIIESFGSGNAPTEPWFIQALEEAINRGVIVLNVSQCAGGKVVQGRYATSSDLDRIGVIGGSDLTTEAAVTKMMYLLGNIKDREQVKKWLSVPISGEMS
ncbi:MAG: asparaginase [Cytophagales bacterium]|nr:asparaginase [Cytophagales bacterium]